MTADNTLRMNSNEQQEFHVLDESVLERELFPIYVDPRLSAFIRGFQVHLQNCRQGEKISSPPIKQSARLPGSGTAVMIKAG